MTHPPEVLPGRRLDAHHHLWSAARVERGDYPWMPTDGALRGDHLPEHLAPSLEATGVGATVVVQAAPSVEETRFLLELAHATDFVLGVTGWVALDRPEDAELLAELAADPYLRAVRPMIHDLPDPNWVTRPQVHANLERIHELGLRFEALTRTEHLPAVDAALAAIPELPAVINHLSKPTYRPDADDGWRQWMLRLAARPNTWCKFSGMLTEVGPGWSPAQFQPYAEFLFETFGADRVMFGSDWPVSSQLLAYTDVVALTDQLVTEAGLSAPAEVDAFWAHTAERFYGMRAPAAATPTHPNQPLSRRDSTPHATTSFERRSIMAEPVTVGLLVRIEALPGREGDVENFLQQGLGIVEQEPNTVRWFAIRFGPSSFGIYDAFPDDSGRQAHLSGDVAQALKDNTGVLFAQPTIEPVDVIAEKPPI